MKEKTNKKIKEGKQEYYRKAVDKLRADGGSQLPYKILKELSIPDRPAPWTVTSLRPSLSSQVLAEELAEYFVKITNEFAPLPTRRPQDLRQPILAPHAPRSGRKNKK